MLGTQDLSYHVPSNKVKGERAYLLKNVGGFFQANQLSALMGASGSGKTVGSNFARTCMPDIANEIRTWKSGATPQASE